MRTKISNGSQSISAVQSRPSKLRELISTTDFRDDWDKTYPHIQFCPDFYVQAKGTILLESGDMLLMEAPLPQDNSMFRRKR
jgi:hypothetical protein